MIQKINDVLYKELFDKGDIYGIDKASKELYSFFLQEQIDLLKSYYFYENNYKRKADDVFFKIADKIQELQKQLKENI